MGVLLAIHHREGSFSHRWMEYCDEQGLAYRRVSCYDNDIISVLSECDALLWHWAYYVPADAVFARQLIQAIEPLRLVVFPNRATCWHFDDKIAQKYLLEAVGAPLVPTYVFYDQSEALRWIEQASFPKVFKLSKGSGSENVKLVRTAAEARKTVRTAFGKGFAPVHARARLVKGAPAILARAGRRRNLLSSMWKLPKVLRHVHYLQRMAGRENGYFYVQDFLTNNQFDTRVTVIGNRAFGFTRNVRHGDFRASGSGRIDYNLERLDERCVTIAFEVARKLRAQSVAFDFLMDETSEPRIAEISYAYNDKAVHNCPGHWDESLHWNAGHMWPQDAILIDLLAQLGDR